MLKTTSNRSAKNSPSDMAENTEVESGTSSTTRSDKNLPRDMAEDAEVDSNGDDGNDQTVKRSPLFKKPNGPAEYLTSLRSDADSAVFEKR